MCFDRKVHNSRGQDQSSIKVEDVHTCGDRFQEMGDKVERRGGYTMCISINSSLLPLFIKKRMGCHNLDNNNPREDNMEKTLSIHDPLHKPNTLWHRFLLRSHLQNGSTK